MNLKRFLNFTLPPERKKKAFLSGGLFHFAEALHFGWL